MREYLSEVVFEIVICQRNVAGVVGQAKTLVGVETQRPNEKSQTMLQEGALPLSRLREILHL